MSIDPITPMPLPSVAGRGLSSATAGLHGSATQSAQKAEDAAKGFEAVFLSHFVDAMLSGLKADGMFGGGTGEKMWRGFLAEHIADAYAEQGGIGIADIVKAQVLRSTEE